MPEQETIILPDPPIPPRLTFDRGTPPACTMKIEFLLDITDPAARKYAWDVYMWLMDHFERLNCLVQETRPELEHTV